jgi:formylglycine-generating enzyme required for sulfatase activity
VARRPSTLVVVVVASVVGVALAGAAGARPGDSTAAPPAPGGGAAPASHDDSAEPDEPHGGDNPYDESPPTRPTVVKQPVVVRDGMVRIPAGRFKMGSSSPHAPTNERPAHTIAMPAYWIDRTEVTVGAYRGCVESGACSRPARASATCTFDAGDAELPVSCVHWRDADAYCRSAGKRLPSESEWEYAAHGPFATTFPWGGPASCSTAVTLVVDQSGATCLPRPARVGTHPAGASVFGVQDMSGNVEEWTVDWYVESLGPGPAPRAGAAHVLRGGGWLSPPTLSRTTTRNWGSALEAGPNVGFRCAKDAE